MQRKLAICLNTFLCGLALTLDAVASTDVNSDSTGESPDRSLTGFEDLSEAQPLWEFGVGGGVAEVPNYPASDERNTIGLAAPYLVYRGDVFRIGGGNGARAVVVEESDWELDVSFGGAFAADSDDNTAREGMPELDFLFEVGPQVIYKVRDFNFDSGGKGRLNARLQARSVFSTDFNRIEHRGYVLEPNLSYQQRGVLFEDTALSASISAVFATEKLHDYFYEVDAEFVTPNRDFYDASGGYLGTDLSVSFSFPVTDSIRAFIGSSLNITAGAANDQSPLFENKYNYSIAAGFVWRLYQSDTKASW